MLGKRKILIEKKQIVAEFPSSPPQKIALVGEAGGEKEEAEGKPFVGASGKKLDQLLGAAGIDRTGCLVTNVIMQHPPLNDFSTFFSKEKGEDRKFYLRGTGWLKHEHQFEFDRLVSELVTADVKVIVALGGKALWALTGEERITKCRGTVMDCQLLPGVKVVPTFHPSYVLRTGGWSDDVVKDLELAKEVASGGVTELEKEIWINPTIEDIVEFKAKYLDGAPMISADIETEYKTLHQIECIGLSADDKRAIVIPFCDFTKPSGSYWKTPEEELKAWELVVEILTNPKQVKLGQNFIYDMQYLYYNGVVVHGPIEDTMLMAHAISPERPKDLGYLVSTYGKDKQPWKTMVSFTAGNKENV